MIRAIDHPLVHPGVHETRQLSELERDRQADRLHELSRGDLDTERDIDQSGAER